MKTYYYIVVALLLMVTACNTKNKNKKFTISGKVENTTASQIVLDKLSMETGEPSTLDTAQVSTDGSFSLSAPADEESVYRLMINGDDAKQWIFVNDNKDIQVTLNGADIFKSKHSGSKATTELYTFLDAFNVKDSLLMHDLITLDSLQKKTTRSASEDSLLQNIAATREAKISDMNTTITNFITSAESPAAKYFVITALGARSIEPEQLSKLINDVVAKHKDHKQLGKLKEMVDNAMTQRSQAGQAEPGGYALLNKEAPDLAMKTPDGADMKISDFKGKYVLVDFWASWCGPCRAENPNVVAAYNAFKDKNFTILGVSLDKDKAAWLKAIKDDNLPWNHMSDLKQWESAAVPTFGFDGIPFNVLLDPSGRIIAFGLRGAQLHEKLSEVLK